MSYNLQAMEFDLAHSVKALQDNEFLATAFLWDETPEGDEFWLSEALEMTDAGRAAIDMMICQHNMEVIERSAAEVAA